MTVVFLDEPSMVAQRSNPLTLAPADHRLASALRLAWNQEIASD
jgi:hypothetical protein